MTLEVRFWEDGSVSVSRDGGTYDWYQVKKYPAFKLVELDEPEGLVPEQYEGKE